MLVWNGNRTSTFTAYQWVKNVIQDVVDVQRVDVGSAEVFMYKLVKNSTITYVTWLQRMWRQGNWEEVRDDTVEIAIPTGQEWVTVKTIRNEQFQVDPRHVKVTREPIVVEERRVPGVPILISPDNNAYGLSSDVTLVWYKVPDVEQYTVQVAKDSSFQTLIVHDSTVTDTTKTVYGLPDSTWYYWRVNGRNAAGTGPWSEVWKFAVGIPTGIRSQGNEIPEEFALWQNYPNPFNPSTTIRFSFPQREHVTLKVFDVLGREVATLVDGEKDAGEHSVVYNANGLPSGVYVFRLQVGQYVQQIKMEVIK
jgi:hypothetical protein